MCAQCAAGATAAATAMGGVVGLRVWLSAKGFPWLTHSRLRLLTAVLIVLGLAGGSMGLSGT